MILYRCEDTDDFRNSIHYARTIEDDKREKAERRTKLWHYTNIDVLYKIIANRTIRFSRIDCVNDISEKEPLEVAELYLGTYIACFSHNEDESIPLWSMYTSKGQGIRIEFEFSDNNIQKNFIGIDTSSFDKYQDNILEYKDFRSRIHDIEYSDSHLTLPVFYEGEDIFVDPRVIAFEKKRIWEYEDETRIMMFTAKHQGRNTPPHIDFILDFSRIKKIKVVFDPWMSPEVKKSVELTTKYYLNEYANIIEYYDSFLEGKIR